MFDFIFNYIVFLPFIFLSFIFFVIYVTRKKIIHSLEDSFNFVGRLSMVIIIGCCITILTEFLMLACLDGVFASFIVAAISGTTESFNIYICIVVFSLFFIWLANFIYKYLAK